MARDRSLDAVRLKVHSGQHQMVKLMDNVVAHHAGPEAARVDFVLEAQARVLQMIARGEPLSDILAELCLTVERESGGGARASILLVSEDGKSLATGAAPTLPASYSAAIDGVAICEGLGTCADAAARRCVVVTTDIATAPSWVSLRELPMGLGLCAAWSMPIVAASGAVLGTFGTYFRECRGPTPRERQLVEVMSWSAAVAVERRLAERALRESSRKHRFLSELSSATQPLSEPAEIMRTASRMLAEHLDVDRCAYAQVDDEQVFDITGDHSRGVPSIVGRWEVAAFGPRCVQKMLAGEPFVVTDVEESPELTDAHLPAYRATNIRAVICVPLHKHGKFSAAMAVHQTRPRAWTEFEIDLVTLVTARCWEALERARVTRTLRASEARYRMTVEASPECVKIVAPDGSLLQINGAGLRMLEVLDEQSVIGASFYQFVAQEDLERFQAFNERVCAGERAGMVFDIVGRSGTRRTLESTAVPLPGGPLGYVQLAVTRDVTEKIAAERARAHDRARLDYAVRASGVGFWYCDLPFDELNWDAQVKEHFFLPVSARVDIDLFYARIHPDDRETTRLAIDAAIAEHASYDVVYRTVDPEHGRIKWIRAMGSATYAADGAPTRFDGVTLDVTTQRLDQERLADALERERAHGESLREQDRRKDEFLATLAHELRNPLAPIRTGLAVLQLTSDPAKASRAREMMERQLGHMVRMVDDLLDISRVTLGKVALKKEHVDFCSAVHSALEATMPLIESGGHTLEVQLPPTRVLVDADGTRLSQIISNLLNNAAKYTPSGGRIELAVETAQDALILRVTDNGIGIPSEMLPRVFDMFTQVGRSIERAQGGLGIGLTLVKRLVELHGGSVEARSGGVGLGSTFLVRLPLLSAATGRSQKDGHGRARDPQEPLRVLVVDDNIDGAEALSLLLELNGQTTRVEHCGVTALAAVAEFGPDVVFLDIGLPGVSGYEVAQRVRADTGLRQPLLVALTGWGSEEDRKAAHEAGFDRHLVKPFDTSKLADVLALARA